MGNGIPSAVQQQAEEADLKARQVETPEPESPEPAEAPASPEANEEGRNPEQMSREQLQSEMDKPLPPSADEGTQEAYWEHRFRVVKGLLDKEKAQLNREREQLNSRIRELEGQLQQQPESPQQPQDDLARQAEEEHGEDDPLVQQNRALQQQVQQLTNQVNQLQGVQQESAAERFWADLNAQVPDWEQINDRREFLEWLNLPDPVSGEIRDTLLQRHQANGDGQRAAAIFEAFLNENPQIRQEMRGQPQEKPPQRPDPNAHVEPSRSPGGEPEQPETVPYSEYFRLSQDFAKGRLGPDGKKRFAELEQAASEGRLDMNR